MDVGVGTIEVVGTIEEVGTIARAVEGTNTLEPQLNQRTNAIARVHTPHQLQAKIQLEDLPQVSNW